MGAAKPAGRPRVAIAKLFDATLARLIGKAEDAAPPPGPPPDDPPEAPAAAAPADEVASPLTRVFRGLPVVVDRPRGFVQQGTDAAGKPWRRVYHVDYGHVANTRGGDGDGLDVFLGGDNEAAEAHWILQHKADGTFDEYKVMLGFQDAKSARQMYEAHIPKRFFGSMCSMSLEMMKALLGIEPVENVTKVLDGLRGIVKSVQAGVTLDEQEKLCACTACAAAAKGPPPVPDEAEKRVEKTVRLTKAAPGGELRYVLGIVLEPETVDAQGDIYSADEIRKSAWNYMVYFRNVGLMHKGMINGKVELVECYIAPADMLLDGSTVKAGTWMMGLRFADEALWGQVKRGEMTGLSIGGFAKRDDL